MTISVASPWGTLRIKSVVSKIGSGKTPAGGAETYVTEGITFLRSQNIHFDGLRLDDVAYIDEATHAEMQGTQVKTNDVLLNITGASLGRVTCAPRNLGTANVNQHVCILRPTREVNAKYLTYFLSSRLGQEQIFELQVGGNRDGLNFEQVGHLRLPAAPLNEQRRITDFLDGEIARIDDLAELRRKQGSVLEERYNTVISELTTPGIGEASARNHTWPWLPRKLDVARLGYLARVQSGVTVHGARDRDPEDAEYPYLRVANVQGERVDLTEVKTITIPKPMAMRSTLRPGDVVMTEANGNPDNLGRGAVWHGEIANMVHQNHVFAVRVDPNKLIPEYLSSLLAASHGRRYFRFTSSQVGIATTSSSKVLDFPIPVRNIAEQRQVVREYAALRESVERVRNSLSRQIDLLSERRQAVITAAVTGQFDVSTASGRNTTEGVTA
ncbi:restriction endonuclease subunit S [Streptomyces olivaceus]